MLLKLMLRCTALAAVLSVASMSAANARDLTGKYVVEGKNPDGSAYGGTAEIEGTEGGVCAITWATGNGQLSKAFCMRQDDVLGAAYELSGSVGLVIYRLDSDGVLEGSWTIAGKPGAGQERLTPSSN